jgi:hypothetical protein
MNKVKYQIIKDGQVIYESLDESSRDDVYDNYIKEGMEVLKSNKKLFVE